MDRSKTSGAQSLSDALLKNTDQDEFNNIKLKLAETIHQLSKKLDERDEVSDKNNRNMGTVRLESEIRQLRADIDLQFEQMSDTLRRQRKNPKKYPESTLEVKQQQYDKYKALVEQLKVREEGETTFVFENKSNRPKFNVGQGQKKVDVERELNDIEVGALNRFKDTGKLINELVGHVDSALDGLMMKAQMMGEEMTKQQATVKTLNDEIGNSHQATVASNAQLRKLL